MGQLFWSIMYIEALDTCRPGNFTLRIFLKQRNVQILVTMMFIAIWFVKARIVDTVEKLVMNPQ